LKGEKRRKEREEREEEAVSFVVERRATPPFRELKTPLPCPLSVFTMSFVLVPCTPSRFHPSYIP